LAGLVAICNHEELESKNNNVIFYLVDAMRMLQHRGKAYWKMIIGNGTAGDEGSLPDSKTIITIAQREKLRGSSGIGYLSKRQPPFPSMNNLWVAFDGFFVDTEKLHLHPYVGPARDSDSLFKIYHIFNQLLLQKKDAERAAEFLDRHLRGNLITKVGEEIYSYRDGTGFKPLVIATNRHKTLSIIASENSLRSGLIDMEFAEVPPGQLLKISRKGGIEILTSASNSRMMIDPFEFIRESSIVANVNGKSIYQIRKNIGREQANFLSIDVPDIDFAYAEPDYTRPMTLGFSLEYIKHSKTFDFAEGIIKDRYDDADHMIDFSEQVSKNKLLTTGRSLKFVMHNLTKGKKIAAVQGTIQTGSTARETIYYLKNAGARRIDVIVSYVPTVDGRQVGLYTQNRDLIANKYIGEVSTINELNRNIAKEIGSDSVFYNSPAIISKGIGMPENNLWFPEWVRFLDYT
jgi:amidophosphoribosyltransferase